MEKIFIEEKLISFGRHFILEFRIVSLKEESEEDQRVDSNLKVLEKYNIQHPVRYLLVSDIKV